MKRNCALALIAILTLITTASAQSLNPHVALQTSMGNIVIELYPDDSPVTVANFLDYVDSDFYIDLIFHRVVKSSEFSIIQGGGFDDNIVQKTPNDPIILESDNGLSNTPGTIAMARTTDPNSATSQFYFNVSDNSDIFDYVSPADPKYCVFGTAVSGLDVIDAINNVSVSTQNGYTNVPVTPVYITDVSRLGLDLVVVQPEATLYALSDAPIDVDITIQNLGTETAYNHNDPCTTFTIALYRVPTAEAEITDPCAQLLSQYYLLTLNGQTPYTDTISFNAPTPEDTYYLKAVVDDGNNVPEFVETNNITDAFTLIVEPNEPDLQIGTFETTTFYAEPNELVTIPVELLNEGGGVAVNASNPGDPFWTSLYISDDPCLTNPTLIADACSVELAGHTELTQELTFNAPTTVGTYYLYAVADDANDVLEPNELNNQSQTATLEVNWAANDVTVTSLYALPGASHDQDLFMIFGTFDTSDPNAMPSPAQMDTATYVTVSVGPYQATVPRGDFTKFSDTMYMYRAAPSGITYFLIDLYYGRFIIIGQSVDLAGLTAPIDFEISIVNYFGINNGYRGVDTVQEDVINGAAPLSIRFNKGIADTLSVTNYSLTTYRTYYTNHDTLSLIGQICSADEHPDIAQSALTLKWGTQSFTIPAGADGLRQIGNRSIFVFSNPVISGSQITFAYFDFENCYFRVAILEATSLLYPSQNLNLEFKQGSEVIFQDTVTVE
ncbi:MAG: peptidylprolyl isomerase [Sedimentisphaerales bacterium]|nr:peptidylprolyl isomerase [Sedimentisphaerales bacterium]